ncbi:MAG: TetR/AcrR family transcriptional regulator [Marinoscillum sp.]
MVDHSTQIRLKINESIFIKDPDSSEIGKRIISESISLMDQIGWEAFTIKKLGKVIGSAESTIYRYFENKHKILLYLTNWYWCWLDFRLVLATANMQSTEKQIETAIRLLTKPVKEDSDFSHINEVILNRLVIEQSSKVYNTEQIDDDQKKGMFEAYTRLVQRVSDMVLAINPEFPYAHMLISSVIEAANKQYYFAEHLPSLTDTGINDRKIPDFFVRVVFNTIKEQE